MHFGATFWIEYMRVRLEPLWVYDGRLSNNIRRFGATYEHFLAYETFGEFRGRFEVILRISTSNCMCDACIMHTCTGWAGPAGGRATGRACGRVGGRAIGLGAASDVANRRKIGQKIGQQYAQK